MIHVKSEAGANTKREVSVSATDLEDSAPHCVGKRRGANTERLGSHTEQF